MKSLVVAIPLLLAGMCCPVSAGHLDSPDAAARAYLNAEIGFDVATLDDVLANGFVEVSPIGDLDSRAQVLGFYAPDKKIPMPPVTLSGTDVHRQGDLAFTTTTATYTIGGNTRQLVFGVTVYREPTGWKVLSAQATPKISKPAVQAKP